MREVAGSTPGLDFYILCEPICVSLCLFSCGMVHQGIYRTVWRGATYDPGH
jgi:hypothetical protein